MPKIRVSSTLTIYHDGQFWVGMFERVEDGKLSVCRRVFGAEPSAEEICQLVCTDWNSLGFTAPIEGFEQAKPASNPKRRQRDAARELAQRGPSTKAQQALSQEREASSQQRKDAIREQQEEEKARRFELRQEKRKRKHRGK